MGAPRSAGAIRIAVAFVNYGPYHVTRAGALVRRTDVDPVFIELSSVQKKYPWHAERKLLSDRLVTLSGRPYEEAPQVALCRETVAALYRFKPDVLISAGYSDAPMRAAARWARAARVPVLMMASSTEADSNRRWWRESLKRRWLARYVDAAFVPGSRARDYMIKLGIPAERIWTGSNIVGNEYFAQRVSAIREDDSARVYARTPYFLYIGRFSPEKNLPLLLRAYASYLARRPGGWPLVMVGDGPERGALHTLASTLGLNSISWPGFKRDDELPQYYAGAGCLVLPSTSEPWGLVVNEAMASSLPVLVSTQCGCASDLVQEGHNGYCFDPYRVESLLGCLLTITDMHRDRRIAMGSHSASIISDYSAERWAATVSEAVRRLYTSNRFSRGRRDFRTDEAWIHASLFRD